MSFSSESAPAKKSASAAVSNDARDSPERSRRQSGGPPGPNYDEQVAALAPPQPRVQVYKDGEIVLGVERFRGTHHVTVQCDGAEPENIDHAYVFGTDVPAAAIRADMAILARQTEINEHFDDGRLKRSGQQTQNGQHDAPRKLIAIMKRQADADTQPARLLHAVTRANSIVQLHPYANGNGRMSLYALYEVACTDEELLDISALDLHALMLGEENQQYGEENPQGVAETLAGYVRSIGDEETREGFLASRMALLETLEADRAARLEAEAEAEAAARLRRPGGAQRYWERQELEASEASPETIAALIERGWIVADVGVVRDEPYDGYQVYFDQLDSLWVELEDDEDAQATLGIDDDDVEAFLDATRGL